MSSDAAPTPEPPTNTGRMAALSPADPGTPEPSWLDWLAARTPWPTVEFGAERLVVLAAHPDDEVLGAGGMMAGAARAGVQVVTVCLSDGSGSHPDSPTVSPDQLAIRRRIELDTATRILGLDVPRWCGLPDGALTARTDRISTIIETILDEQPTTPTALLSVWDCDGHPDHEAVGRCAAEVGSRRGVPVWMYPIWMWHWAYPGDPGVPWHRLHSHRLDDGVLAVKRAAVNAFESQIHPLSAAPEDQVVLGPHILSHLLRDEEFAFR